MEQYKLPKNIRQIGDKEDWIRVYIEDYVHTYIQKLRNQQENSVAGGILLGKKQRINGTMHLFITGAAAAEDPFWKMPNQTPGVLRTESSVYFPELEVCGFFMSSRQSRTSEVELLRIFETYFNTEQQILLDIRGQDEDVFSYSGHSMVRLAGYYIYYEKNEGMQNYILRQDSFRMMDDGRGMGDETVDFSREDELYAAVSSAKGSGGESRILPGFGEKGAGNGKKRMKDASAAKTGKGVGNVSGDRRTLQEKSPQGGQRLGIGLFGGKLSEAGERDSGPGDDRRNRTRTVIKDSQKNKRDAVKKGGGGKVKKGDMIVRGVSVAGIFVLAFLLFSDQVHLSRLNPPSDTLSDQSGISSVSGDKVGVIGDGAGISEIIRADHETGGVKETAADERDFGEQDKNGLDDVENKKEASQQAGIGQISGIGNQPVSGSAGSGEGQAVSGSVNSSGSQEVSGSANSSGSQPVSGSMNSNGSQVVSGSMNSNGSQAVSGGITSNESQLITGSVKNEGDKTQSELENVDNGVVGSESGGKENGEQADDTNQNGNISSPANTHVFPMKYLVKKGDSLYAISEKYYGTIQMVDAICLENNITDPEKVNYGIVLTLPAPPTD